MNHLNQDIITTYKLMRTSVRLTASKLTSSKYITLNTTNDTTNNVND